jgi:hypothetical protein
VQRTAIFISVSVRYTQKKNEIKFATNIAVRCTFFKNQPTLPFGVGLFAIMGCLSGQPIMAAKSAAFRSKKLCFFFRRQFPNLLLIIF